MKKLKLFALFLLLPIVLSGCSLLGSGSNIKAEEITLEFWGVFDSSDAYKDIIAAYQIARPNIKINYKKLRWQEYEQELINAWAENKGPDIFMVHNTWVGAYQSKITPLPAKVQVPILVSEGGTFNRKTVTKVLSPKVPTTDQVKQIFVNTVWQDAVRDGQTWGLPLSVDTLALYYNRDLLDASGVVEVPTTWEEMTNAVTQITRQDSEGNIVRSGVAMGGSNNIYRSADILALLMMQNGTQMVSSSGKVTFDDSSSYDSKYYPGERALDFYTDFAEPMKEVYTWNSDMPEATDAFIQGKLAMLFDYAYDLPYIRAQAPSLNFSVSAMPHINTDGTDAVPGEGVNLASYWLLTSAKQTEYIDEVWDFIMFATMNSYTDSNGQVVFQVENYLDSTSKPPALRSLLNKYRQKSNMQPFVSQVLSAENWYFGQDFAYAEKIFDQIISNIITGSMNIKEALRFAAQAIQNTY